MCIRDRDMALAILSVKRVFDGIREKHVKISITGGMRALGLAVFIAQLLTKWRHEPKMEVYLEGRGAALAVPDVRKLMVAMEKCADLVQLMKERGPCRLSQLALELGKDRSTVYRKMKILVGAGAAKRTRRGYELTVLGEMLV